MIMGIDMSNLIITTHAKNFICTRCGKCCSNRWQIPIDEDIYEKYLELSLTDKFVAEHFHYKKNNDGNKIFDFFVETIEKLRDFNMTINIDSEKYLKSMIASPTLYINSENTELQKAAAFVLNNAKCSFLTDTGLCYIHDTYGPNLLSSVCFAYPRLYFKTSRGVECGLSYSCPTSVKYLATPLSIETSDDYTIPLPHKIREIELNYKYFDKEDKIISIIQEHDNLNDIFYSLEREIIDHKPPAVALLSSGLNKKTIDIICDTFTKIKREIKNTEYDTINTVVAALKGSDSCKTFEQIKYIEETVYAGYEKMETGIISRYFENYFFTKNYYTYRDSFGDCYLMLLYIYNLIKFYSICFINEEGNDSKDVVLKAIRFVENTLLHNSRLGIEILCNLSDWY